MSDPVVFRPNRTSKTAAAPRRQLKLGLLHSLRAVEIEAVNTRMSTVCVDCGALPKLRRLYVQLGAGRGAKSQVRCMKCGPSWLTARQNEYGRARAWLQLGEIPTCPGEGVRLPETK